MLYLEAKGVSFSGGCGTSLIRHKLYVSTMPERPIVVQGLITCQLSGTYYWKDKTEYWITNKAAKAIDVVIPEIVILRYMRQ